MNKNIKKLVLMAIGLIVSQQNIAARIYPATFPVLYPHINPAENMDSFAWIKLIKSEQNPPIETLKNVRNQEAYNALAGTYITGMVSLVFLQSCMLFPIKPLIPIVCTTPFAVMTASGIIGSGYLQTRIWREKVKQYTNAIPSGTATSHVLEFISDTGN